MLHPGSTVMKVQGAASSRSHQSFAPNRVGNNQPDAMTRESLIESPQNRPMPQNSFHASVLPSIHPFHARVRVPNKKTPPNAPSDRPFREQELVHATCDAMRCVMRLPLSRLHQDMHHVVP